MACAQYCARKRTCKYIYQVILTHCENINGIMHEIHLLKAILGSKIKTNPTVYGGYLLKALKSKKSYTNCQEQHPLNLSYSEIFL